jgi:hypothetical protein
MRTNDLFVSRAAIALIIGATITTIGGIIVQAAVEPTTVVSDKLWSYPWSSTALVPVSLLWASLHLLVFAGILGLARSGLVGPSRAGRIGIGLALAGTALLFVGELASIPIRHAHTDDTSATIVGALFAIAVLLSAIGFLTAGLATLKARIWHGWGRLTILATGIWTTALLALNATHALPTGVAIYGLCLLATGTALYTTTSPSRERSLPLAPQEQRG